MNRCQFDCIKFNSNSDLVKFFQNNFESYLSEYQSPKTDKLTIYQKEISVDCFQSHLKLFINYTVKEFFNLENETINGIVQTETNISKSRDNINNVLCSIPYIINKINNQEFQEHLSVLRNISEHLWNYDEPILLSIYNDIKNGENNIAYQLLHSHLDIRLTILSHYFCVTSDSNEVYENLDEDIIQFMVDLMYLSVRKFQLYNNNDNLISYNSFYCPCIRDFWFLIETLIKFIRSKFTGKTFWEYTNDSIKIILKPENDFKITFENLNKIIYLLIYDLSKLQITDTYDNCEFAMSLLENILKNILQSSDLEEKIIIMYLQYLDELLNLWNKTKISLEPYYILWNFFNQKLEYCCTSDISNDSNIVLPKSIKQFILRITLISDNQHNPNNSFDYFLHMFRTFLFYNPKLWPKFRGRLYTKFSIQKLKSLNEIGLYHVATIFLTISIVTNFNELCDQLFSIINQLDKNRIQSFTCINIYLTVIIIGVQKGICVDKFVKPIVEIITELCKTRKNSFLISTFIEGLQLVFEKDECLSFNTYLLLDDWFQYYLNFCSKSEVNTLMKTIRFLMRKLETLSNENEIWLERFEKYILESLKSLILNKNISVSDIGAIMASYVTLRSNSNQIGFIISTMVSNTVHVLIVDEFLCELFTKNSLNQSILRYQTIIIQAWVRISLMINDYDDGKYNQLVNSIESLPIINKVMKFNNLSKSADPIRKIIELIEIKSKNNTIKECTKLKDWCIIFFGDFDKWITNVLNDDMISNEIIVRIYLIIAELFSKCSDLLYYKNQNDCLLNRILNSLLLNNQLKKPLSQNIISAISKTWILFVIGLSKLEYDSDHLIEAHLRNIVIKYLPYYVDSFSPFIQCLDDDFNENVSKFILEIISSHFIRCKNRIPNDNAREALFLLDIMINTIKIRVNKLEFLIENTLLSIFEHVIFANEFTPTITLAIKIIKTIYSFNNIHSISNIIIENIILIADKHLAFNAVLLFKFLEVLKEINANLLEEAMPSIEVKLFQVEKMRGLNYDKTLRDGFYKLKNISSE